MSASNHLRPSTAMDNLSALYEGNQTSGLNNQNYNNSNYFDVAQNPAAAFDPNWAINSRHVPSRSQSQSTDPAWQHHQYQQHVPQQHQQYQNPHAALYRQQPDFYATPYARNTLNYNDSSITSHNVDTSFPFDPALGSVGTGQDSNLNTIQSSYPTVHTATISPHALQVTQDAIVPGAIDAKEQQAPSQHHGHEISGQKGIKSLSIREGSFAPVVPKGTLSGEFTIINFEDLVEATKSSRLHNYVNISKAAYDIPITKTTIPVYVPRKSRNELQVLSSADKKLLTKIAKKPSRRKSASSESGVIIAASAAGSTRKSTTSGGSASDTTSSSAYSSDSSDSIPEISEVSPLPIERPTAPLEAVRYDTIRSLWRPRNRTTSSEQIRKALVDFWEVVRTIRDRWKTDTAAVKQAEEAKKTNELPLLRDRVKSQRDMMESAIKAALAFGHPNVLRMLGENPSFVFVLYQFLVDRAKENDYAAELARSIFEILAQCTSLTQETLDKTNMSKMITRFSKRASESSKPLIHKIQKNAADASSKKSMSASDTTTDAGTAAFVNTKDARQHGSATEKIKSADTLSKITGGTITGVKRARVSDVSTTQPGKRALSGVSNSGISSPVTDSAVARAGLASAGKRTGSASSGKSIAIGSSTGTSSLSTVVSKPKGNQVVAKPTNFFSSLQPALRKNTPGLNNTPSGSANVHQKAVTASIDEKKHSIAPSVTASKPSFSFAQMMADVTKPREAEPIAKDDINRPPETVEEKAKRLRKEERRKLRVSFKPEASLVSVRFFTHDPEEIGHEPQMTRDAGDINGEGRMFKQHKDKLDLEEDEELPQEESIREWLDLTYIDFSDITEEERSKNYRPHGGGTKEPVSPESEARMRYEASSLIVIYTHPSDIPPTPREPADPFSGEHSDTVNLGTPSEEILSRIKTQQTQAPVSDISAILGMLNNNKQQQQAQSDPSMTKAQSHIDLERVFASFSSTNQAQLQQTQFTPQQLSLAPSLSQALQQQQQQQASSTANPNLQAILAALAVPAQTHAPQTPQQPVAAALQQPSYPGGGLAVGAAGSSTQTSNLSALLASLGQANGASSSSQAYSNPDQQAMYEDPERKRAREAGDIEERDGDFNKRRKWGGKPKQVGNWPKPQFVVPCKFFKEGKCTKGALCTFLHD